MYIKAGVDDLANALELQRRENATCDPNLYNMTGSDACGIAQELPCGKSGCGLPPNADALCQVKWQMQYVKDRYTNYAGAIQHHNKKGWY